MSNSKPAPVKAGRKRIQPWSYLDQRNLTLTYNPGLDTGQLLHITCSGVFTVSQVPTDRKVILDVPEGVSPVAYQTVVYSGVSFETSRLQADVISRLTPRHHDCRMVIAWIMTAPLAKWIVDPKHLRIVATNQKAQKHIINGLSYLLYGRRLTAKFLDSALERRALRTPVVINGNVPTVESLNLCGSTGALITSIGTPVSLKDAVKDRTVYAYGHPGYAPLKIVPNSNHTFDYWRGVLISAQAQIIGRLLQQMQAERLTLTDPIPYVNLNHDALLRAIMDIMDE